MLEAMFFAKLVAWWAAMFFAKLVAWWAAMFFAKLVAWWAAMLAVARVYIQFRQYIRTVL
jgi:hypothetical protein